MNFGGFSIIVCCYNSQDRIEQTLRHLWRLEVPYDVGCEVIVVNNGSSDETEARVSRLMAETKSAHIESRLVNESSPGLSFARMRGVIESRHDVIIFCDDDNHFASDYLAVACRILIEQTKVGILGGWARPTFSVEGREWLIDFYKAMAIGPQGAQDGLVEWVYGAGMIVRKEVFESLRERKIDFHLTDRIGNVKMSGGDAELCVLARFLGWQVYYSKKLSLVHAIPEYRLRKRHYLSAELETVYPSMYLFLLEQVTGHSKASADKLFWSYSFAALKNMFHYLPRTIIGGHRFFSFFSVYRNGQILWWTLTNRKKFNGTFQQLRAQFTAN